MAIAACFLAPTPNPSVSVPKLTHFGRIPSPVLQIRLSAAAGATPISSCTALSLHRHISPSPLFCAAVDNGGGINSNGNNNNNSGGGRGGGSGGGNNNGDGEGDENREKNRKEALRILAEAGISLESLPKDLAAAIESGRIPGSVVSKFLELQRSSIMRWLMQFGGFKERLLADDLFLAKVAMECGVGIFTKV